MKLLVFSDSHSGLHFMRFCVQKIKPNAIIHLGDHYDDAQVIQQENPHIPLCQVPGNCDRYRCPPFAREVITCAYGGVRFFITHGHIHHVKSGIGALLADARSNDAKVVLYGHTHRADCHLEDDGIWVMNPGACGSFGGSVGVIEIENEKISACGIVTQAELDRI